MGQVDLEEFRDDLRFDLLDRDDVDDAWLERRINKAYVHVCNPGVYPHREMQETEDFQAVLGQVVYPIDPTTVGYQIVSFQGMHFLRAAVPVATTQSNKMYPRDIRWFDKRTASLGSTPNSYGIWAEELHIDPIPNTTADGFTMRARVWREPVGLTADTDLTVIPANWDEIIQLGARWRAERDIGYRDKAELTKQDYAALLNEYVERQDLEAQDTGWEVEVNHGDSIMEL